MSKHSKCNNAAIYWQRKPYVLGSTTTTAAASAATLRFASNLKMYNISAFKAFFLSYLASN